MVKVLEGELNGKGKKFAIVVSRFNSFISDKLLEGAKEGLLRHDVKEKDVTVAWTYSHLLCTSCGFQMVSVHPVGLWMVECSNCHQWTNLPARKYDH